MVIIRGPFVCTTSARQTKTVCARAAARMPQKPSGPAHPKGSGPDTRLAQPKGARPIRQTGSDQLGCGGGKSAAGRGRGLHVVPFAEQADSVAEPGIDREGPSANRQVDEQ